MSYITIKRKSIAYLNPVRQVKTGARQNRGYSGQSSPQHAQHCHLIGLKASASLPHTPLFILHSWIIIKVSESGVGDLDYVLRPYEEGPSIRSRSDVDSRFRQRWPVVSVAFKSSPLYVMAGKRHQSIVQVTFIRVLMVTSRLAWCTQEEGRENDRSIRVDRSLNLGSNHASVLFSSMNALIIVSGLRRRFPLAKTFGSPWLIRPLPDYPARKTWPRVSLRLEWVTQLISILVP